MQTRIKRRAAKLAMCVLMCSFSLLLSAGPGLAFVDTGSDTSNTTVSAIPDDWSDGGKENTDTSSASTSEVPPGQGTVIENTTSENGREFFTIVTQDENTFYLVIDRQRESENVYFLDTVKESDLLSLAEKDKEQDTPEESAIPEPEPVCTCTDKCVPGEVDIDCPVCLLSWEDCTAKDAAPDSETAPKPETQAKGSSGTIILVVIVALAAGGAGYYFKIYKPKKDLDDAEDFDELTGEDEEETVNEDDVDPASQEDSYGEPEEPDYPEGYGYEEPEDED